MSEKSTYEELKQRIQALEQAESKRERAEVALRESEEKYRHLFETAMVGIYRTRIEDGKFLVANQALAKMLGYESVDRLIEEYITSTHYSDPKLREELLNQLQSHGRVNAFEIEMLRTDGSPIQIVLSATVYPDQGYLEGVIVDITKRKRAEAALRKSEEKYRSIFENAVEGFFQSTPEGRFLSVNPAFANMLGYTSPDELIANISDIATQFYVDPEDRHRYQQLLKQAGSVEGFEFRAQRKDGSQIWVSNSTRAYFDKEGNVVHYEGNVNDITARKRAEEALRENIHFLESLETINQAVNSSKDPDQMLNNVIETVFKLFDCDRAWLLYPCDPDLPFFTVPIESARPEYPGGKDLNLNIPMSPPMQGDMVAALTADGPVTSGPGNEKPLSTDTQKTFRVQSQMFMSIHPRTGNVWMFGMHQCSYPRVWTDNERVLFNQIGRRIADALNSLLIFRELTKSEEKYRLLADNITDNIWVLDLQTLSFTYVSPSVVGITGYTADEATGLHLQNVLTPSSVELATSILSEELTVENRDIDQSRSRTLELEQYHKDGTTVWTEISVQFVYDSEGQPTSILGVTRDISERKRLQSQLQKAQKMESLGLMAGGIAHDLNNILSGIVSYPDLLLMDLPEGSPLRKPLETIKESGYRAAEVVSDLLTVVKGVAVSKETLNLNTIVAEYLDSAEQKKLEKMHPAVILKTDFDPGLLNISCSSVHVKKSLMNLAINAYESIESNGLVAISSMNRYLDTPLKGYEDLQAGEYVLLTVADDGSGISSKDFERIFEPFYTKKVMGRKGTGLGLAVVWNMIHEHDGYINIKSDDQGTVFELYFPASRENLRETEDEIPLEDYVGQGEKILVIDDEKRQREIACALLTKLNYSVDTVSGGEEAIEYLQKNSVDLIVLDMIMPMGMNGRETYEQIIKISPNQKAIIASGFSETEDVKTVQRLGAKIYIKKPYTTEKIGLAVKKELGR